MKYAKVIDTKTRLCEVGLGDNTAFYTNIGMTLMNVERSDFDNQWYLSGFAPQKSEKVKRKEKVEERISELLVYLSSTDWYTVRFAETGVAVPEEIRIHRQTSREEIDSLRHELADLEECVS